MQKSRTAATPVYGFTFRETRLRVLANDRRWCRCAHKSAFALRQLLATQGGSMEIEKSPSMYAKIQARRTGAVCPALTPSNAPLSPLS
jgi:hypothetical protein